MYMALLLIVVAVHKFEIDFRKAIKLVLLLVTFTQYLLLNFRTTINV